MGEKHTRPVSDRKHEIKERKCLQCGYWFKSLWIGNRLCSKCKSTSSHKESSICQ